MKQQKNFIYATSLDYEIMSEICNSTHSRCDFLAYKL